MKIKLPPRVRITHKASYEVVYTDHLMEGDVVGECRPDSKQIVLYTGQTPTQLLSTFIHETIHAINFETPGLNITENQTLKLEKALLRFLRLNKLI